MIRRPPRSTLDRSSAASDVYKRQPRMLARGYLMRAGLISGSLFAVVMLHAAAAIAGPAPVSYTHLRAHETVLDLVCRLLLEKKKKKELKR